MEEMNLKRLYRHIALLLCIIMAFSLVGCNKDKDASEDSTEAQSGASSTASTIKINLHYLRDDSKYDGWNVWMWADGLDGSAHQFDSSLKDDNGVVTTAEFPAGTAKIGFIVRLNEWEQKDTDDDRFIDLSSILAGTVDVFVKSGSAEFTTKFGDDCVKGISIQNAVVDGDYMQITGKVSGEWDDSHSIKLFDISDKEIETKSVEVADGKMTITLEDKLDSMGKYYLKVDDQYKYDVVMPDIFSTDAFENEYAYDGDDLGAIWSKDSTTFKVWAPTAKEVKLNLYKSGDAKASDLIESIDMESGDKGVWSVKVDGNKDGIYYTYTVNADGATNETCDPYAKTAGVNGQRAMVIDLDSTDPEGWANDKNPNSNLAITDASIYELVIRDLSSDASAGTSKKGYLALTENGTKLASGKATCLDHIKELGITHVQLNPVYDFASVDESAATPSYNWGYDPLNYSVPEGSYSSDATDGKVRVNEFKQMVQSLHGNGISVVMDVVYNHTYNTDYCFNKIVPGYFYRENSNGSGCGNDVASERAMVRKLIVDSVVYWAKEYHIDGFRFDLQGLLDVETMNAVREGLNKVDPSIIIYGEGWSMSTNISKDVPLSTQINSSKTEGISYFSDTIRDAIKGSVFTETEKGYVNGSTTRTDTIKNCIQGKCDWTKNPSQIINYTSCHDNLTLWDKINSSNGSDSYEDKVKQNLLAASIVYTSQGTPFILAGEELLRSKVKDDGTFDSNSYVSPDSVNSIKWSSLDDAKVNQVYEYYKGLIEFRKAHASLRVADNTASTYYTFAKDLADNVIAYELAPTKDEVSEGIYVIYNPTTTVQTIALPSGDWKICVDDKTAGTDAIKTVSGSVEVNSISCMILVKGSTK